MILLKVPTPHESDDPTSWDIIKVEKHPTQENTHTIEFVNKRFFHGNPWPNLEFVVPNFRNLTIRELIHHPNLTRLDSLRGEWVITCHYGYGSCAEAMPPVKVWQVGDAQEAMLLLRALEDIKYTETEEYAFYITKRSEYIGKATAVKEMEDYLKEQAAE